MRSVSNQPELRGEAEARPFLLPSDLVRADVRRPVVRCAARHPQHADVARDTHRGLARPAAQQTPAFTNQRVVSQPEPKRWGPDMRRISDSSTS